MRKKKKSHCEQEGKTNLKTSDPIAFQFVVVSNGRKEERIMMK